MKWLRRLTSTQVLVFSVVLIVLVFIGWYGAIRAFWANSPQAANLPSFWSVAEGLSSAASFAAVIGGGLFILAQLVESVDSRHMAIYNDTFKRMMSQEETEARRWIMQEMPAFPDNPEDIFRGLTAEEHWHIKRVLNSFDHLGFMLEQGWMTDQAIIGWVSPMVVKVWAKLGPYIDYEADRRREPDYYSGARYLARVSDEWRAKHEPEAEVVFVDDAL